MNSVPFHDTLNDWSKAKSLNALANMVLEYPQVPPLKYKEVADQVNSRIKKFVSENKKSFFSIDLPALKRIQDLLPPEKYTHSKQKKHVAQLRETIKSMIRLTKDKSDFSILPPVLASLCEEYSSMNECLNLSLAEITSSPEKLIESISKASETEIADFVKEVRQRHISHPHIFEKQIYEFFQYASPIAQNYFFQCLSKKESAFLNDIICALPENLTHLNIIDCMCLESCHLENIAQRLNNLHTLTLSPHPMAFTPPEKCIEIKAIEKMPKLRNLNLNQILLTNEDCAAIAKMTELQSLDLSRNYNISYEMALKNKTNLRTLVLSNNTIKEELYIQFSNVRCLQNLNLKNCFLTKKMLKNILKMHNLKDLNLAQNQNLDDEVAREIAETPFESNLQTLDISNCPFLTDKGAMLIVKKFKKLTHLNFTDCNFDAQTKIDIQNRLQRRHEKLQDLTITKKRKRPFSEEMKCTTTWHE